MVTLLGPPGCLKCCVFVKLNASNQLKLVFFPPHDEAFRQDEIEGCFRHQGLVELAIKLSIAICNRLIRHCQFCLGTNREETLLPNEAEELVTRAAVFARICIGRRNQHVSGCRRT
jgi:hypothetical protein